MFYPILRSGTAVQYPLSRRTRHHIVSTRTPGGFVSRIVGGRAAEIRWELRYEDLTDAEARALEELFLATGGGLREFTFIDPLANLLRKSEDLQASEWETTGLGVQKLDETECTSFRLANGNQAAALAGQSLGAPPGAMVCMSCEARGAEGARLSVVAGNARREVELRGEWQRVWACGTNAGTVSGVLLPAGGAADVRRMQAELQLAPSAYKAGDEQGGTYAATRFEAGGLKLECAGPDRNSAVVRLASRRERAA